jgi:hypothetical protein
MKKNQPILPVWLIVSALFFSIQTSAQLCPSYIEGTSSISGIINSYFQPAEGTLSAGANSFTLLSGASSSGASSSIADGDLLLIIQMQDGTGTDYTNTANYGTVNTTLAGQYEFVIATSGGTQADGSSINFVRADGTSGGLYNQYVQSPDNSDGRQTFQIVKVPNYQDVILTGDITAVGWDGLRGGIVALRVLRNTDFNNTYGINVMGLGFRGAAATAVGGNSEGDEYRSTVNTHGALKGEGIAGTPSHISGFNTFGYPLPIATSTNYPLGSFMRGAPGNAGGGGKDNGNQPSCSYGADVSHYNSGGGGGGNVGVGGHGGKTWCTGAETYGFGGKSLASYTNRMFMGGGGGAGESQSTEDGYGGNGGGIVFFFTNSVTNTTVNTIINANADSNNNWPVEDIGLFYNALSEGGGGGGAGGSVLAYSAEGLSSLSITARGGTGGNAILFELSSISLTASPNGEHGPGGGGGGGKIIHSTTTGEVDVAGGFAGTFYTFIEQNLSSHGSFGAEAGTAGEAYATATSPFPASCLVLPVGIVSFTVKPAGNTAQLQWITATETNNKGFEIQRSTDGTNWYTLGFMATQSSNQFQQTTYNYTDASPYQGNSYYRLKQIDIDNGFTYSSIVRFSQASNTGIVVYPNPAADEVFITGLMGQNSIEITNISGQVFMRLQNNGRASQTINVSKLATGTYFITIRNQDGSRQAFKVNKK